MKQLLLDANLFKASTPGLVTLGLNTFAVSDLIHSWMMDWKLEKYLLKICFVIIYHHNWIIKPKLSHKNPAAANSW